jgi:hypothetical protein
VDDEPPRTRSFTKILFGLTLKILGDISLKPLGDFFAAINH